MCTLNVWNKMYRFVTLGFKNFYHTYVDTQSVLYRYQKLKFGNSTLKYIINICKCLFE